MTKPIRITIYKNNQKKKVIKCSVYDEYRIIGNLREKGYSILESDITNHLSIHANKFTRMTIHHKKDGGWLEFEWGNALARCYRCNVCMKTFVLPTTNQLNSRPWNFKKEFRGLIVS